MDAIFSGVELSTFEIDKRETKLGVVFGHSWYAYAALLTLVLCTLCEVGLRYFAGVLVDCLGSDQFSRLFIGFFSVLILLLVMQFSSRFLCNRAVFSIKRALSKRILEKLLYGRQSCLDRTDLSSINTAYVADVESVASYANRMISRFFPDVVKWATALVAILLINPYLCFLAVASSLIPFFLVLLLGSNLKKRHVAYRESLHEANKSSLTSLYSLEFVKANRMEDFFSERITQTLNDLHEKRKELAKTESLIGIPISLASFFAIIVMAVAGGWFVLSGYISIGQLVSAIGLVDGVVDPVMNLDTTVNAIRKVEVSLGRLNQILTIPAESSGSGLYEPIPCAGFSSLRFEGVSFVYDKNLVLDGFSCSMQIGRLNVVTGANGSGKTTLFGLILKVYKPDEGRIILDNKDIASHDTRSLRGAVSCSTQKPVILSGGVKDNLGCHESDSSGLLEISASYIDDLQGLLNGVDCSKRVSFGGKSLSGGQRRCVDLYRCLSKDRSLYLLDEPTVSLDAEKKKILIGLLKELSRCRFVVVITHDSDLMAVADDVIDLGQKDAG